LLEDSLHVQQLKEGYVQYSNFDIKDVLNRMQLISYRNKSQFKNISYEFFDAGHIPGSASILLEISGKKILYSGDINLTDTYLLDGADIDYKSKIDVLIIESTYGSRDHPSRKTEEKNFVSSIKKILADKGSVLVPVFSLGRAHEIAILLSQYDFGVPIYMDGMARKINSVFMKNSSYITHFPELKKAMDKIRIIKDEDQRSGLYYSKAIFLSTAGMLDGGPVLQYMKHMYNNSSNGVLMTGFQGEGSNGRMLLESSRAVIDGQQYHFDGMIKKYDFSAHSGKKELHKLIEKTKPKAVIINHGDVDDVLDMERFARTKAEQVYCPEVGETITIE
jgi:putative mRNA 3-end processing factor